MRPQAMKPDSGARPLRHSTVMKHSFDACDITCQPCWCGIHHKKLFSKYYVFLKN